MHKADRHELNAGWELPGAYGIDRLVLLPKDPHWLFAYWEVTAKLENRFRKQYGADWDTAQLILRIHDLETGRHREITLDGRADNNYLQVEEADHAYYVEMGRILPNGSFISMLISNIIRTPRNSISAVIDPSWKMFAFWQQQRHSFIGGSSSFEFQADLAGTELLILVAEEEK
ncbi:MAG: DUF4912 domain-containing protein [Dethiobacter sp.]|jgi:hypothetical protein|nr:DUF4912 domain-containing protein [Dethiobacter sp.]MBS3899661.1 DUF4912 domain-containing protein [Dethiobacter sp.]MBS3983081.1 DUF4912 domain-containing protein [Dethiobacter sp.]MCL4464276.1 DUF4912 domain-containing protein [Bacillota bacterium]MCL5993288.1 DUF4912 domain-containing protein [Bacillota bacterium]